MRLLDFEKKAIVETAKEVFGEETKVYQFGSRVYEEKKGGDIDLYIIPQDKENLVLKELKFKSKLKIKIGEQKMDVVIAKDKNRDIEKIALKEGVLLNE